MLQSYAILLDFCPFLPFICQNLRILGDYAGIYSSYSSMLLLWRKQLQYIKLLLFVVVRVNLDCVFLLVSLFIGRTLEIWGRRRTSMGHPSGSKLNDLREREYLVILFASTAVKKSSIIAPQHQEKSMPCVALRWLWTLLEQTVAYELVPHGLHFENYCSEAYCDWNCRRS